MSASGTHGLPEEHVDRIKAWLRDPGPTTKYLLPVYGTHPLRTPGHPGILVRRIIDVDTRQITAIEDRTRTPICSIEVHDA